MDKISISRRFIGLVALVLYFNIFFFHKLGPVSFSLQMLGMLVYLVFTFWSQKSIQKMKWTVIGFSLSLFWGIITLIFRTNGLITGIYYWFNLAILGYLSYLLATDIPFFRSILEFKLAPFNFIISYFGAGLQLLGKILSGEISSTEKASQKSGKLFNTIKPIVVGLLISIPVIFILINLLRSADPIYASYVNRMVVFVNKIFQGRFWIDLSNRLILSAILAILLCPFLLIVRRKEFHPIILIPAKNMLVAEMTVVSSLVAVTLGSFLFIEWPYIFAKVAFETDLSKFGVATYSEYVKRGFGELLAVTFIVYVLVWAGLYILRNRKINKTFHLGGVMASPDNYRDQPATVRGVIKCALRKFHPVSLFSPLLSVQIVVLAEFFLFILSIFRRVWLYQAYHGWSLGRIYGGMVLLWVTGMVLILFWRHLEKRRYFIKYELIFTLLIIVIIGLFNAESFIVTNHPPTVNKKVDYVYLSRMSPDGFIGWQIAYQYAQKVLLDDNLLNKKEITRDDRREIAYAGMITRSLLYKYQILVDDYGSDSDKQVFYGDLLSNLQKISSDVITVMPKKEEYKIEYLNMMKERISGNLANLNRSKPDIDSIANSLYLNMHPGQVTFDLTNDSEYLFYGVVAGNDVHQQKVGSIDKIFNWNYGRSLVYQKMKNEINYKTLLSLQYQHYILYKMIIRNNPGDTNYDTDISFDTPFLEWI